MRTAIIISVVGLFIAFCAISLTEFISAKIHKRNISEKLMLIWKDPMNWVFGIIILLLAFLSAASIESESKEESLQQVNTIEVDSVEHFVPTKNIYYTILTDFDGYKYNISGEECVYVEPGDTVTLMYSGTPELGTIIEAVFVGINYTNE